MVKNREWEKIFDILDQGTIEKNPDPSARVKFYFQWSLEHVRTRPWQSVEASVARADQFLLIQSWKINWECSQKKNLKNPLNKMVLKKKTSMLKGNGSFFPFLFCVKVLNTARSFSFRAWWANIWDKNKESQDGNKDFGNRGRRRRRRPAEAWFSYNLWICVSLEEFKKKFISADGHGTEVVTKTEFVRRFSES